MTTPAQDAPLVFPSVAFRPLRLFAVCVALTGLAMLAAGLLGHIMVGVFFGIGLGLGLLNAVLVQRSVEAITAEAHPLKRKMALNSATRLLVMTVIGLTIAFLFLEEGHSEYDAKPLRPEEEGPLPGGAGPRDRAARDEEDQGRCR